MLRLAALALCALLLGACGSTSTPQAAQTGPNGLFVSDQAAMGQVRLATDLYRQTATSTRTLLVDQAIGREELEVRLDAELFQAKTIVERTEQAARLLRAPALVRGMRKVIRLLREQTQQYELAAKARLAGDPEAAAAATAAALELGNESDQTLRRLLNRFPALPG